MKTYIPGQKVECGKPYSPDFDEGFIVECDGDVAVVAWQSGVRTPVAVQDLRAGWSGRYEESDA